MSEPAWVPLGGAVPAPTVPVVLARRTTAVDVVNTTVEQSLYDGSAAGAGTGWTIPAGVMGIDRMLRLTLFGDTLYNRVAGDTITLKFAFGGVTIFAITTNTTNTILFATRHPWYWRIEIGNLGVANSQFGMSEFISNFDSLPAPSVGLGSFGEIFRQGTSTSHAGMGGHDGLGAIDTTLAQKLDVTAKWSAAGTTNSWRMRYSLLELV